jgi:hypothetical protein
MTRQRKLALFGVLACSLLGFGAVSSVGMKESQAQPCYQNWGWPVFCECTGGPSVGGRSCRPDTGDSRYCKVGGWCGGILTVTPIGGGGWGGWGGKGF